MIRSFSPAFDPAALSIREDQHQENDIIKEAKRKVILKNLNYLRNTEPLMEEVTAKKDEEIRLLNEDSAKSQGKDTGR